MRDRRWSRRDLLKASTASVASALFAEPLKAAAPPPSVAGMVGAQYYWIRHHDPVALIGYMLMLECNAPTPEVLADLKRRSRLPESFFRTHRIHAELDPDHQSDLLDLATALPLSPAQRQLIDASLMHTLERMADCLADLAKRA